MKGSYIVGVGDTPVGKLPDSSTMQLHAEATTKALADTGLRKEDIDGVLTAYSVVEPHLMLSSVFCEYYGLSPKYTASLQLGGATGCTLIMHAQALIESGQCETVLIVTGDNRLTGLSRDGAVQALAGVGHPNYEYPYGITIPALYGLVATKYMDYYHVQPEHLAQISVTMREHASLHPFAHKREPITVEDVLNSKLISTPLHLLDCCLVSDGGGAVIVTSKEVARNLKKEPVKIMGSGQGHTHEHISQAPSLLEFGCKQSSQLAFQKAGVSIDDIDVAEIYDSFTITLLIELESIGFFEKGEAGSQIANGAIGLQGKLPLNTHGGLLSYGHSGAAGGLWHAIEAVKQLRGEGRERQVQNANLAFVHGDGGILSAHCSLILGKD
jgi:acetyl-CoA acetyltransferase